MVETFMFNYIFSRQIVYADFERALGWRDGFIFQFYSINSLVPRICWLCFYSSWRKLWQYWLGLVGKVYIHFMQLLSFVLRKSVRSSVESTEKKVVSFGQASNRSKLKITKMQGIKRNRKTGAAIQIGRKKMKEFSQSLFFFENATAVQIIK